MIKGINMKTLLAIITIVVKEKKPLKVWLARVTTCYSHKLHRTVGYSNQKLKAQT